jgi:hypothetical protein
MRANCKCYFFTRPYRPLAHCMPPTCLQPQCALLRLHRRQVARPAPPFAAERELVLFSDSSATPGPSSRPASGVWGSCAMNARRKRDAVPKMKVDPSKPVCGNWLQTAVSCFRSKDCGGERYPITLLANICVIVPMLRPSVMNCSKRHASPWNRDVFWISQGESPCLARFYFYFYGL